MDISYPAAAALPCTNNPSKAIVMIAFAPHVHFAFT